METIIEEENPEFLTAQSTDVVLKVKAWAERRLGETDAGKGGIDSVTGDGPRVDIQLEQGML